MSKKRISPQRYILTGIVTFIPIWLTFFVFDFLFGKLSDFGTPWVNSISHGLRKTRPEFSAWLEHPWFVKTTAVVLVFLALYVLGFLTTQVIGRKLLNLFDNFMAKIPVVQTIYGSTKKFLNVLQSEPGKVQRVVLINFPSEHMKTVGFVTTTFQDSETGQELAAVYVPTTPNPTSGYLEIVPVGDLVSTQWNFEEAMTFIISGGAVAPDTISYQGKGK